MSTNTDKELAEKIIAKTLEFGADLAGFANIADLKTSPSNTIYPLLPDFDGVGTGVAHAQEQAAITKKKVVWPEGAQTILVFALSHPEDNPRLDYWRDPFSGGTEGNLELIRIGNRLEKWLVETQSINSTPIPYVIEQGGIFLKDACNFAGLGVVGENNMLVTPRFGPRVRMRALGLPLDIPSTGKLDFDPCKTCGSLCRKACPNNAFGKKVFSSQEYGQEELPAREGVYARQTCNIEMEKNIENAEDLPIEGQDQTMRVVRYCRRCEFACPVGKIK
jgi:epoxyqueuosine reductase